MSLRQWRASSELLFQEQSRNVAVMMAEKVDMALEYAEDEVLARVESALERGGPGPRLLDVVVHTPLATALYLFDRAGHQRFPAAEPDARGEAVRSQAEALGRGLWDRGGRRHAIVGDDLVMAAVLRAPGGPPLLAVLVHDPAALRRDILEKTLGGPEGPIPLTVTDHRDRPIYRRDSPAPADLVAAVPLGEALPAWRLALFQPTALSPQTAVRRQAALFSGAFGLLLVVIAAGLVATYRLVRHETEMARLKADFVANVSHDLKTPLSLIRVFAETLEMGRVSDDGTRREYYGVITRESERLSRLIDNVLDFSRIESGHRRYERVPVPVEPLVRGTLEAFGHVLAQGGFEVDVAVPPDLPEVPMDADAVGQALANLVDNAIKYSDTGKALRVEAATRDGELAISVSDDGIGIPGEEHARIFEKFYRVGRSETQGRRGSGVGLALVRHVAEAHGGRVTVESQPGRGSRFTLWLPLAAGRT